MIEFLTLLYKMVDIQSYAKIEETEKEKIPCAKGVLIYRYSNS